MQVQTINFSTPDEFTIYQYRWSSFKKILNEIDSNSTTSINGGENKLDAERVSILNLPSLNRGKMASRPPLSKLESILSDKQRLYFWIENYKNEFEKSFEKDSFKIATFREAATRLKMLLDHSDFDEGNLRNERRKAIKEINDMFSDINEL